jgi:hypothetical protein
MKSFHRGCYAGLAILLAACEQPAGVRPAVSPVPERDVRAAAAVLPVSQADLVAAEAALSRSTGPDGVMTAAPARASETDAASALRAAAALQPLLASPGAADRLVAATRALSAAVNPPEPR